MIKYIFLFISLIQGCYIDIKNNTLIKDNCFIEFNHYSLFRHNYILELPIKKNNLIKFEWNNINSLVNIQFSWYNTTQIYDIPDKYTLLNNLGSIKLPYDKNKRDLYHCDSIKCDKFTEEPKSGIMYIYIMVMTQHFTGTFNFILETYHNYIKKDQLNILKNIWYKCCSETFIIKPPIPYSLNENSYCNWIPTPWGTWNNTDDCENIYNIDCDEDGNIQHLFLSNKGLRCDDISEIQNLTNLNLVDLSYNYIKSDIKIFSHINNMTEFNLAYNYFYGDINNINNKNLSKLNLKFNKINGDVNLFTSNHNKLKLFDISYNNFEYQIIPKFNNDIEYINIGRNNFYGYLDDIVKYKKLRFLDISFNNFNQNINISQLELLKILNIRNNNFNKFFIIPSNLIHYDTSYNLIDDSLDKIDVLTNAKIDISNNKINIIINEFLEKIILKNSLELENNIFECINNKHPSWIYYYFPKINKCKNKEEYKIYNNKSYYPEFFIFLLLFFTLFGLNIIYLVNKYKNKRLKKEEKEEEKINIERLPLVE